MYEFSHHPSISSGDMMQKSYFPTFLDLVNEVKVTKIQSVIDHVPTIYLCKVGQSQLIHSGKYGPDKPFS